MKLSLSELINEIKAGKIVASFQAETASKIFNTPLKKLPHDIYLIGKLKCTLCGKTQIAAWPYLDKRMLDPLECKNCGKKTAVPMAWNS